MASNPNRRKQLDAIMAKLLGLPAFQEDDTKAAVYSQLSEMGFVVDRRAGLIFKEKPDLNVYMKLDVEEGVIHANFNIFGTAFLMRKGAVDGELWFSGIDADKLVPEIIRKMRELDLHLLT